MAIPELDGDAVCHSPTVKVRTAGCLFELHSKNTVGVSSPKINASGDITTFTVGSYPGTAATWPRPSETSRTGENGRHHAARLSEMKWEKAGVEEYGFGRGRAVVSRWASSGLWIGAERGRAKATGAKSGAEADG